MTKIEVDAEKFKALLEAVEQLGKCHTYRDEDINRVSNVQKAIRALAPKPEAPERAYAVFDGKLNAWVWDDTPMPGSTEYIRADLAAIPVKDGERGWMETRGVGIWEGPFAHKKIFKSGAVSSYFIECEAPND
jgi:hypothetical protein